MAPPKQQPIQNDVLQELAARRAAQLAARRANEVQAYTNQIPLFTPEQLPRVEKHLQGVEILNARSTKTTGPRMGLDAVQDIYGPEFQESMANAKARRIEIQSHLPDVGIERTKDAIVEKLNNFLDNKTEKAGDVAVKSGLTFSATMLGVLKKVPITTGMVASAPAGVVLEADPANTLEAIAEARLEDIAAQQQKKLDQQILMLQAQGLVNNEFQVLPVWEQDP